jgi:hypothetical protein
MDGVLANMEAELLRQATILFGAEATRPRPDPPADSTGAASGDQASSPAGDASSTDPEDAASGDELPVQSVELSSRQRRGLWRHVHGIDGFWESLEETETGIVARLWELTLSRHWEIIFLTKRPATAGATAQLQTQRWLAARGFPFPSVYVVNGSRGRIAASLGLDVVVDDTPQNCLDVATDSRARVIGVFTDAGRPVPPVLSRLGIQVARSTSESLDLLTAWDDGLPERPGRLRRALQFLGIAPGDSALL